MSEEADGDGITRSLNTAVGCVMQEQCRFNTPELLDGLRRGDRQVWEAFYHEQWEPLCRFIQARLPDKANIQVDSEDLAQEVLCRAYTGIRRFRGEASLWTWLRSIAQHVIIDTIRAASLRQQLLEGSSALESVREGLHARGMPDPEVSALREDVLGKVLQELQTVLGKSSSLFLRRHLGDLSEEEVADAEGLKLGTASGYLSRARSRLRRQRARFRSFL
jgi:RNA polymerase sigma-70 factor (ECF subfamily)